MEEQRRPAGMHRRPNAGGTFTTGCKGLIRALREHTVHTAQAKGWDRLSNGALLKAAEDAAFDVLLTTDRRIRYQQNLSARGIALVVLTGSTKWSRVRQRTDEIAATVATAIPGSYTEVEIPFDSKPSPA